MYSGIDFDVSKPYKEILRDKYHYEEFRLYSCHGGENMITKLNGRTVPHCPK